MHERACPGILAPEPQAVSHGPLDSGTRFQDTIASVALPSRRIAARYGIAALAVLVGTAVRLALTPLLGPNFPFATLFLAVLVAAWHGGKGPAIAATFLGAILSAFLLLPPNPGFQLPALLLYLAVGLGIAELGGRMRESRVRAERQFEAQLHADAALR